MCGGFFCVTNAYVYVCTPEWRAYPHFETDVVRYDLRWVSLSLLTAARCVFLPNQEVLAISVWLQGRAAIILVDALGFGIVMYLEVAKRGRGGSVDG